MTLKNQPTAKPSRKVTVAFVAGAVVNVAAAIVAAASSVHIPSFLLGPATLVAAVGAAYVAKNGTLDF